MADLQELIAAVDELPASDLQKLYQHIGQRLRRSWWIVPSENIAKLEKILQPLHEETAQMSEAVAHSAATPLARVQILSVLDFLRAIQPNTGNEMDNPPLK